MKFKLGFKKILSTICTIVLLFGSLNSSLTVLAQESTPEPTPDSTIQQTYEPSPTDSSSPSDSPSALPTVSPTDTESPTETARPTDTPTDSTTLTAPPTDQPEAQASPSESPTTIPTATPPQPGEEGDLTTTLVKNIDLSGITLLNSNVDTPNITTDKPDYSPTSMVLISGTGFTANKTYSLEITSSDEPPEDFTDTVTADPEGNFIYSYQLDGNFRPKYKIEVKNGDTIVASTTFTDSDSGFKYPTSTHTPNSWDTNTVANVQSTNNVYASDNDNDQQGYSNFSFGIPDGAVINGIETQVEAKSSDSSGCEIGVDLSWNNGSNYSSQKTQSLTGTDVLSTLGTPTDSWGSHSWLASNFSDANFVARVEGIDLGSSCSGSSTTSLDLLQIKVYYTVSDTTPPETTIDSGPTGIIASTSATFTFSANESSTFKCQIDGGGFSTCSSPKSYNSLSQGSHTFAVQATDTAGNIDATPVTRTWSVDTLAPALASKTIFSGWYNTNKTSTFTYTDAVSGIASGTPVTCDITSEGESQTCSVTPDVCDTAGNCNTTQITSNPVNIDKTNPEITLFGDNPMFVEINTPFVDPGYEVSDNLTPAPDINATVDDSGVDTSYLGMYEVIHDATDLAGNKADQKTRTVNVVDSTPPTTPVASPEAGDYTSDQSVTLTSSDAGTGLDAIYYTTDGTTPDEHSIKYNDAITVDHNLTLKAIAYDLVGNASDILTADYGTPSVISTESPNATSSGGGGTSPASPPVCNDTKPSSAPTLISAVAGTNSVTLNWIAASDPVTYYLVTYGTSPAAQTYGNPNVGGAGTTNYTVSGLSGGTTYYFRVRAGNGCMPGDFSNELSATPTGVFVTAPAAGFTQGVLSAETEEPTPTPVAKEQVLGAETSTSPTPTQAEQKTIPILLSILGVLLILGGSAAYLITRRKSYQ